MLHSLPPQPMYPSSGIHFRNPFSDPAQIQSQHKYDFDSRSPSSGYNNKTTTTTISRRPITPPPDMNTVAQNVQHSQYSYYGDRSAAPVKHEQTQIKYEPSNYTQTQVFSNAQPKQETVPQTISRPRSPVFTQNPNTGASRRSSQANSSIAPSLQIPRSVNNSQGSLAELAAQITCLFWFESSSTLEKAEASSSHAFPIQSLVTDAIPTTGFRKWVTTILSTTQVAQNVIILALLFIYRLKKLNPTVKGKPGSEYRLLTVALMLGNKFLDDNTYTNKTWAEVSGISVAEVHIMEVEFLSNMKYALFTSAEEWAQWQTQLGRFASFFEQASRAPVSHSAVGALGITLPSPPASNHASPPYSGAQMFIHNSQPSSAGVLPPGPTPIPSPMAHIPDLHTMPSRKRSLDTQAVEPPAKRLATGSNYGPAFPSSTPVNTTLPPYSQSQFLPRVPLPSLAIPASHQVPQTGHQQQQPQFMPQLPPLNYPQRSMAPSQAPATSWAPTSSTNASATRYAQTPMQATPLPQSVPQSRHQSPYPGSANVSPTNGALQPAGQAHPSQLSPSYYLEQRNSPYRPIRGVSTLLVPPPSGTTQQPQNVGRDQMHYQPLGRPQERQSGQLPYIAQNQWFDGQHQSTASAYQWPSFMQGHQQQQQQQQAAHTQLPLPTPSFGRV